MGDRLALGLTAMALVFLGVVIYLGLTLPARPEEKEYMLEIQAEASSDAVLAGGVTNLPAGSQLTVYVDRLYRLKGKGTWSTARVGQAEAVVDGGDWQAEIPVTDVDWVQDVSQKVNTRDLDPVEAVHDKLRATVVFSPLVPQVTGVQAAMGPNFESLSSSAQALQAGEHWMLRRQAVVERPMHQELEQQLLPSGA